MAVRDGWDGRLISMTLRGASCWVIGATGHEAQHSSPLPSKHSQQWAEQGGAESGAGYAKTRHNQRDLRNFTQTLAALSEECPRRLLREHRIGDEATG